MSSNFSSTGIPPSWEEPCSQSFDEKELHEIISRALDYRGDVTIQLKTGEPVIGYVFDRHENAPQPYVKLFLPNCKEPKIILYQEIAGVIFSGEDMAFGRSWEDWAQKWKNSESGS